MLGGLAEKKTKKDRKTEREREAERGRGKGERIMGSRIEEVKCNEKKRKKRDTSSKNKKEKKGNQNPCSTYYHEDILLFARCTSGLAPASSWSILERGAIQPM